MPLRAWGAAEANGTLGGKGGMWSKRSIGSMRGSGGTRSTTGYRWMQMWQIEQQTHRGLSGSDCTSKGGIWRMSSTTNK